MARIERALISVSEKKGIVEFSRALAQLNVELVSTGGTAALLRDNKIPVKDVSDLTGFPEMMDGRVKTLHPKIHGGILALRDNPAHVAKMKEHGIAPIDLVVVNLYPFEATVARGAAFEEIVENIDIGGPSMVRAAAKNHQHVGVVVDPEDYDAILAELKANDRALSSATHAGVLVAATPAIAYGLAILLKRETARPAAVLGVFLAILGAGWIALARAPVRV